MGQRKEVGPSSEGCTGTIERANQEAEEEPISGAKEGGGGRGGEATPLYSSWGSRCSAWPLQMAPWVLEAGVRGTG